MILTDLSNTIKNCGKKIRFINTLSFSLKQSGINKVQTIGKSRFAREKIC